MAKKKEKKKSGGLGVLLILLAPLVKFFAGFQFDFPAPPLFTAIPKLSLHGIHEFKFNNFHYCKFPQFLFVSKAP